MYIFVSECISLYLRFRSFFFFLNQQFITWHTKADCGSYFIAIYKRNRLTRELKLKGKEEEKEKKSKKGTN